MRADPRCGEKGPRLERGLHPRIDDDAWHPSAQCPGNVLQGLLPHPLLVFSIQGRGTLVLPLYEGEGQITSPAIFMTGGHERSTVPLCMAATVEEIVTQAFAHYQLAMQQAVIPFDQRVGEFRGIHCFRLTTWPGPLYLSSPVNRQGDTLALMALPAGSGAGQQVGHVLRWQLNAPLATEEEEIRGNSLDQIFAHLLWRFRRIQLAILARRAGSWLVRLLVRLPTMGILMLLAALIWSAMTTAEWPLSVIVLGLLAALTGLGGLLLLLQPVVFPRLRAAQMRRGSMIRRLLVALLLILECAALAVATLTETPPIIPGLTFVTAMRAWLPAVLAGTVAEWGMGIMERLASTRRGRRAPDPFLTGSGDALGQGIGECTQLLPQEQRRDGDEQI